MKKIIIYFLLVLMFLYAAAISALYLFQGELIYGARSITRTPGEAGLENFTRETIKTSDGLMLDSWYRAPKNDGKVILFFHGNVDTLRDAADKFKELSKISDGFLAIDYRGFGASEGEPSKEGIYKDAEAAFLWLKNKGIDEKKIIVVGYSLGTAPAVRIASRYAVNALVLLAPYPSMADVASRLMPYAPIRFLLTENFEPIMDIGSVTSPILMIHGSQDSLIPLELGRKLFDAAPEPKRFIPIEGGSHIFLLYPGWVPLIQEFLEKETTP